MGKCIKVSCLLGLVGMTIAILVTLCRIEKRLVSLTEGHMTDKFYEGMA